MRFTKHTQHDTSKVLRLPRKMTMDASKVLRLPRKLQHIFWKRRKSIAPATQNDFRHVAEHVWMSRSATPATRNEATRRLKPPKRTTSVKLPIGTAIRSSRERLRSRTQRLANTPSTPRPPEWNGNPCYAFGKKHKTRKSNCSTLYGNIFLWISSEILVHFSISIEILLNSFCIFVLQFVCISEKFLWISYEFILHFLWISYEILMQFLKLYTFWAKVYEVLATVYEVFKTA